MSNQSNLNMKWVAGLAGLTLAGALLAGCGSGGDSTATGATTGAETKGPAPKAGDKSALNIDGSTTVYPIASAMGEEFGAANSDVSVVVNKAGTGSGFQKFERGEIDIATASRPIKAEEDKALKDKGIDYIELPVAFDGVSIVVNPANKWITNVTLDEMKKAWAPGSPIKMWSDINPAYPKEKINFYGPTENHGTYEYFTEAVVGKKNTIREDYQPNQEYTAIIQSVSGDKDGIAYVGFNYYDTNRDKVKALTVNGVAPEADTILGGTYTPLSRPLFLYVSKKALADKPSVKKFVDYALSDAGLKAVTEAKYVLLPKEAYDLVRKRFEAGTAGSVFMSAKPGMKIQDVLAKESAGK
ncbi:PstS family phosphate ABC transporter substrate-binding protein [Fimbriimonas ginsengisoli]|uniref:Phosphate-binding protein n=1 Tax=Fimbriimonas ginsengisoli Gsoil 348 TaxID=661478 RepID=A0A068NP04_FIMGI|nr:PstS family phosphate ABC transporter substrate-binding protein [Fimbriimonas ginsengisoli]AIE85293.1 phosphate binding protein [Fimbriimonas ginsengisoli Gsoil 348]